jgi:hypothetical protein
VFERTFVVQIGPRGRASAWNRWTQIIFKFRAGEIGADFLARAIVVRTTQIHTGQ